jgi:hypothetical protein
MIGRITYPTTLSGTPRPSPFAAADIFALTDVFADTVALGDMQDIYLYWGYESLNPQHNDIRNISQSASGVVEITHFLTTQLFSFGLTNVIEDRITGNEYAMLNALNNELIKGTIVTWYQNYDDYPAEYISCAGNKRIEPVRIGSRPRWTFGFELLQLPVVQAPSTVPAFVLA